MSASNSSFPSIVATIRPTGRLLFRDSRPFQAGESHAARCISVPPPGIAFCPPVLKASKSAGATSRTVCDGRFLIENDDILFPAPLDGRFDSLTEMTTFVSPYGNTQWAASNAGR